MNKMNVLLALLAVLAIALFVAVGGDGEGNAEHAKWMADTEAAGTWVAW